MGVLAVVGWVGRFRRREPVEPVIHGVKAIVKNDARRLRNTRETTIRVPKLQNLENDSV